MGYHSDNDCLNAIKGYAATIVIQSANLEGELKSWHKEWLTWSKADDQRTPVMLLFAILVVLSVHVFRHW